jgi:SAM-dependent MidA family methyltransferase|tara:strand:- start:428 stop:1597 length:1170 start_codon:yes stop_codon:yes gene_type:complete
MNSEDKKKDHDPSLDHSLLVREQLIQHINTRDGWISFEEFIDFVMYKPGLGYYSAGAEKIGHSGDFTTAPEISKLFGMALANQITPILDHYQSPSIIEIGAGTGKLAFDIMTQLNDYQVNFDRYYILELSADLKQRQQSMLSHLPTKTLNKIVWLDSIPVDSIDGVIIANEVIDALPFTRFKSQNGQVYELGISVEDNQLIEQPRLADEILSNTVDSIAKEIGMTFQDGYTSEIRINFGSWFRTIESMLSSGSIFFVDYGYSRQEYYDEERTNGSMICHYRNVAHEDPLSNLGIQDISASVDFSQLADVALQRNIEVGFFTSQADFLINAEILGVIESVIDEGLKMRLTQEVKQLLLPNQMGEVFKCMLLNKNINPDNFDGIKDLRHTL